AIEVPYTEAERRIHAALREYAASRQLDAGEQAGQTATEFVLKLLKKRLFSSPAAFAATLAKHEQSLRQARERQAVGRPTLGVLRRQIEAVEEDYADDDESEATAGDALATATLLFREPDADERALLDGMRAWAQVASGRPDSKAAELIRWL